MHRDVAARRRFRLISALVAGLTIAWSTTLVAGWGSPTFLQFLSNVGLVLVTLAAAVASGVRARHHTGRVARCWVLLSASAGSWGAGQTVWTWYESVLGREVPFPSVADLGYLAAVPLAAAALLSLPLAAPTLAGRLRAVIDGLMVAGSLLLISWVVVLGPLFRTGGDGLVAQTISLAYPIGDVVVMTIVLYTVLRARQGSRELPVSLGLVSGALIAIAVSDSGFVYLTTIGAYASGSVIDVGWFVGYAALLLAACRPVTTSVDDDQYRPSHRPLGILLPYTAVLAAMLTSVFELLRTGDMDPFVSWTRTVILALMVGRQVLTLLENLTLTRTLEDRVAARTAELAASERRFAALVRHSSDVVTIVDAHETIRYQSASSQRVLGYDPDEVVGRRIDELVDRDAAAAFADALTHASAEPYRLHTVTSRWRRAGGQARDVEVTITNLLTNPDVAGLVLNARDVTEQKILEDQLVHQAFHDSLTALANRALLKNRIEHALTRDRSMSSVTVLFLDLDGFKQVNDSLGHSSGDLLLVQVAERLRTAVRPEDTVARLGGDEFAILVENAPDEAVVGVAHRISEALQEPFRVSGQEVHLRGSIGIAARSSELDDAEQLLRNADLAMYRAKAVGDGGFARYDPKMHAHVVERVRMESDLRRALEVGEFEVHYQPLVSMRTGETTGVEALLRWRHRDSGLVPPSDFIPLAEATGLIRPLGLWVLEEACRQAVAWQASSPATAHLKVNVNVSGRQLQPGLVDSVATILTESGLRPQDLVLELTESTLMDHAEETLTLMHDLKALGVLIAIDDFGTGYSSLSYLHRFPVDVLKIDRSFVEGLTAGESELVATIVRLGQTMRLETVAEGIENHVQFLSLRRLGCVTGQGFHFSKPLPAADMTRLLTEQEPVGANL